MTTTPRPLRVLVVEDDPTLRRVFSAALGADPTIITAEAGDLHGAVATARSLHRPVLLVDLGLPGAGGVEAVTELRRAAPEATLVVITGNGDMVGDARAAGAHEVITKGSPESHGPRLTEAVRRAVARHDADLLFAPVRELHRESQEELSRARRLLSSGLVLLALTGGAAAAGQLDAAEELRRVNVARALAPPDSPLPGP